jgi:hypothetical protein
MKKRKWVAIAKKKKKVSTSRRKKTPKPWAAARPAKRIMPTGQWIVTERVLGFYVKNGKEESGPYRNRKEASNMAKTLNSAVPTTSLFS